MIGIPAISRKESEISQIEDDLQNLHRRYAILDRSARRMKIAFYVLIALLVALILAAAAIGNPGALLLFTAVLVVMITWPSLRPAPIQNCDGSTLPDGFRKAFGGLASSRPKQWLLSTWWLSEWSDSPG
jgi:hypothetical protein